MVLTDDMQYGVPQEAASNIDVNFVQNAMRPYCRVYVVLFQDMLKLDCRSCGDGVDIALADPLFKTRRNLSRANSV